LSQTRIPIHPDRIFVNSLACHEERVVVQPIGVVLTKNVESATVGVSAVRKKSVSGFAKQALFEVDYAGVFDVPLSGKPEALLRSCKERRPCSRSTHKSTNRGLPANAEKH
jgi:hypothetical protein